MGRGLSPSMNKLCHPEGWGCRNGGNVRPNYYRLVREPHLRRSFPGRQSMGGDRDLKGGLLDDGSVGPQRGLTSSSLLFLCEHKIGRAVC